MAGISAFLNGPPPHMFNALAESDEEGQALYSLNQSRQAASEPHGMDGMEPGDLVE